MPYFKWSAITLYGKVISGTNYAPSCESLDAVLFAQEMALLSCAKRWAIQKQVSYEQRAFFCTQLALLLRSGIRLFDALRMAHLALSDKNLRFLVYDCALRVNQGIPLSTALMQYRHLVGDFIIHMVSAGEESGNLPQALEKLAGTLSDYSLFYSRLRAALIMPLITFVLFLALFCMIFFVVIPRFQSMVQSTVALPALTRTLFALSDVLRTPPFIVSFFVISGALVAGVIALVCTRALRPIKERLVYALPGIRYLVNEYTRIQFLQALGILLEGGVPLAKALQLSTDFVGVDFLQERYRLVAQRVQQGATFSDALARDSQLYAYQLDAFIKTGLSAGALSTMIVQAALFYKEQFFHQISFCISLVQPVMLSIMGLLIALLIIALYMPLFTFSSLL